MSSTAASLELGSAQHRHILAQFFLDSHVDYVPEKIVWPRLEEAGRARLTALSFWQEAVSTENITSNTVAAAAQLEQDPQLRKAIEMQGFEEKRHARLLLELTSHYRIKIEQPSRYAPRSLESDFLSAGYGECFDSFFAFGLFALAQESGFFAPELVNIFEPVVQEEARHILFFVNWVRYRRSLLSWWKRPMFRLRCAWIIFMKAVARVKTARSMSGDASGKSADSFTFTARDEIGASITLHKLLEACLKENDRRMSTYDRRLLRPRLVPTIAKIAFRILPSRI